MFKRLFGRGDGPAEAGESAASEAHEAQIEQSLAKTGRSWRSRLAEVFGPVDITDDTWHDLEALLVVSDVGAATAAALVAELRGRARDAGVRRAGELPDHLHAVLVRALEAPERGPDGGRRASGDAGKGRRASGDAGKGRPTSPRPGAPPDAGTPDAAPPKPWVVLVVGVNGSGKTTSIAKLAHAARADGRSVLLVAADTFRAAAIDQLKVWGERVGVPVLAGQPGGDPGAVVFDALGSHAGRAADVVIVDTAGRLHTQANLMAELTKVRNITAKQVPGAPHEVLLVLDATTGQNGLAQAKAFTAAVEVTGLVLAKLDSSAKGGVALAVTRELGLPILYVGTGEGVDDLAPFDAAAYVDGILGRGV